MLRPVIHRFAFPQSGPAGGFESFPAFRGRTPCVDDLACHASVLGPGGTPHPPHAHVEEEILIPLEGEVELRIASAPDDPAPRVERIGPGASVYYPAGQHHTIHNPGSEPVAYLMFKWTAAAVRSTHRLAVQVVPSSPEKPEGDAAFRTAVLVQGPTGWLRRLQVHRTHLDPGGGYDPHADAHDVAIVPLSGVIETAGERVEPHAAVFFPAGSPHGMRNRGPGPARYLVIEFHAPPGAVRRVSGLVRRAVRWVSAGVNRAVRKAGRTRSGRRPGRFPPGEGSR